MVPIKRRSFLKSIAAVVVGGGATLKGKRLVKVNPKDIEIDLPSTKNITANNMVKVKTATDYYNEALEKIERRSGTKFIAEIGEYTIGREEVERSLIFLNGF